MTIPNTYPYWEDATQFFGTGGKQCGQNSRRNGGYIQSEDCILLRPYVCSMAPTYEAPDNDCPPYFVKYKDSCILANNTRLSYGEAQDACARSGSTLYVPKDAGQMSFMRAFAGIYGT